MSSPHHQQQHYNDDHLNNDQDDFQNEAFYEDDGNLMVGHAADDAQSLADSFISGANETFVSGDESVPDLMLLNVYCARAKAPKESEQSKYEAEQSWQPVREWLSSHNAQEVRAAAEQKGESGLTALHFACRNSPPIDVTEVFLSIAADTVQWPDSFGWLPIHYATAAGADSEVIKALAEAYPESKTTVDRRGRTPLHFALGDKPASPDVISLLSSSGAASYPDEIGMLVSTSTGIAGSALCVLSTSKMFIDRSLTLCLFCYFATVMNKQT